MKYESLEFGCCPRSLCENQATIPTGTNDYPFNGLTKVYCPRCRDIYSPQAVHSQTCKDIASLCSLLFLLISNIYVYIVIDGCAFGTTFAQLFFLTFLDLVPDPATQPFVRNIPRVFGFRIHPSAYTSVPTSRKRKVEQIETTKATEITEVTEITEIVNENEDEFDKNKKACLDVPDPKPDTNPDNAGNGDDLMDSNKSPLGIDSAIGLEMNSSRKVTELDILLSPLQSEIEKHQTRPKDYSFTSPIPKAKPK